MAESERIACSFKVKEDDFVAGDIVLWNGEKKLVADPNGFSLPSSGYTPIGVVVIPASHMDDGKARMMATRWMSCEDPENGSFVPNFMVWGTATEISGLTYYTQIPVIAKYDDEKQGGITALTDPQEIYTVNPYGFFSSKYPGLGWTGETNPEDEGTKWKQSSTYWMDLEQTRVSALNYYGPSPYASDGTPNPLYGATSYSGGSINNALSYFGGRQQTDAVLEARGTKDYGTWKPTADTLADFPAVSVCDMYHTIGTSQGDWYLPSLAEMCYIVARLKDISDTMAKINGMQGLPSWWTWASSAYGSEHAGLVNFSAGYVSTWDKRETNHYPVVAFTSL